MNFIKILLVLIIISGLIFIAIRLKLINPSKLGLNISNTVQEDIVLYDGYKFVGTEFLFECDNGSGPYTVKRSILKTYGNNYYFLLENNIGGMNLFRKDLRLKSTIMESRLATNMELPISNIYAVSNSLLQVGSYVDGKYKGTFKYQRRDGVLDGELELNVHTSKQQLKYLGNQKVVIVETLFKLPNRTINYTSYYFEKLGAIVYYWMGGAKSNTCHLKDFYKFDVNAKLNEIRNKFSTISIKDNQILFGY